MHARRLLAHAAAACSIVPLATLSAIIEESSKPGSDSQREGLEIARIAVKCSKLLLSQRGYILDSATAELHRSQESHVQSARQAHYLVLSIQCYCVLVRRRFLSEH